MWLEMRCSDSTPLSSRPWGGSKTCKWIGYLNSTLQGPSPHKFFFFFLDLGMKVTGNREGERKEQQQRRARSWDCASSEGQLCRGQDISLGFQGPCRRACMTLAPLCSFPPGEREVLIWPAGTRRSRPCFTSGQGGSWRVKGLLFSPIFHLCLHAENVFISSSFLCHDMKTVPKLRRALCPHSSPHWGLVNMPVLFTHLPDISCHDGGDIQPSIFWRQTVGMI